MLRMACRNRSSRIIICASLLLLFCTFLQYIDAKDVKDKGKDDKSKDSWKKKDIRDYSEADLERLYEQWEEDEDPLEEDEKPEWQKEPPKIDMSKIDPSDPVGMLKMSKKGRTLMMFATVSGSPTEKETEKITGIWQTSLHNANIETQRYVVGADRVLFMLNDGSKAWEVKDYLTSQDRCSEVTIEGKNYPGQGATPESPDDNRPSKKAKDTIATKKSKKSKNSVKKDEENETKDKSKTKTEL